MGHRNSHSLNEMEHRELLLRVRTLLECGSLPVEPAHFCGVAKLTTTTLSHTLIDHRQHPHRSDGTVDPPAQLGGSAAEEHRLLVEAYNEAALCERTCREWFHKFKNSDFDVEGKDRSGCPKIYEDAELEEFLEGDSFQTQKELALTLEVT
ncbi:Mariner Mos1 transposase [Eumeta japonica]|uniref:Mariner Mos1 transposase n=1 Tax=Eumeta variegata TaxID=151549 RepID=A0A4C1Z2E7_EUMVA|nr:Mariner Mos1 transposase [Eumeta japonica]